VDVQAFVVKLRGGVPRFSHETKILSWNIRRLNDGEKRLRIENLLREGKVDVICLQSPKWRSCPIILCVVYWGCKHVEKAWNEEDNG
jgi:hypothetical protein